MQLLYPLFNIDPNVNDASAACRDNACGAIARMITAQPAACPLDQILPILLKCLPIVNDDAENEPVYQCLVDLAKANLGDLGGALKNDVLRVVKHAFESNEGEGVKISDELKADLKTVFGAAV